jgi:hypothetical protein
MKRLLVFNDITEITSFYSQLLKPFQKLQAIYEHHPSSNCCQKQKSRRFTHLRLLLSHRRCRNGRHPIAMKSVMPTPSSLTHFRFHVHVPILPLPTASKSASLATCRCLCLGAPKLGFYPQVSFFVFSKRFLRSSFIDVTLYFSSSAANFTSASFRSPSKSRRKVATA